jgi:hypothetical protein
MSLGFSNDFGGMNQHVSGVDYCPLSSLLRSANVTLTMPLTLAQQEARSAKKSSMWLFPSTHGKMRVFEPEQWILA